MNTNMEGGDYFTEEDWSFLLDFPSNVEEHFSFSPPIAQQPYVWQAPQEDVMVETKHPEHVPHEEEKDTDHIEVTSCTKIRRRKLNMVKDEKKPSH